MAYRRRKFRRPIRRRRTLRRRYVRPRKYSPNRIFRYKRRQFDTFSVVYDGTVTNTYKAWNFQLDQTEQYAELTSLYDQYRITGIKAAFYPRNNSLSLADTSGTLTQMPLLITAVDLDDSTTPTTYTDLLSYDTAKVHSPFRPFKIFFRPRAAAAIYGAGAFTSYGQTMKRQWIDAASDDVEYYGLKIGTFTYSSANNTAPDPVWDIVFTYYIECKSVR